MVGTFFFFNDTATTEIYTLSLHDALPICCGRRRLRPGLWHRPRRCCHRPWHRQRSGPDRKSTRLNSSHGYISYAVFCLKKKKNNMSIIDANGREVTSDTSATTGHACSETN